VIDSSSLQHVDPVPHGLRSTTTTRSTARVSVLLTDRVSSCRPVSLAGQLADQAEPDQYRTPTGVAE
jgi:hypothetical protein